MDKKSSKEFAALMRQIVSDVQGAPYPGSDFENELYRIWYEHAQSNAQRCFEFLDAHFPSDKDEVNRDLKKIFK